MDNQNKCSNEEPGLPSCPCSDKISKVYLLDQNDCVFENGVIVRMKRKYGKFKRVVHVIDYDSPQPETLRFALVP